VREQRRDVLADVVIARAGLEFYQRAGRNTRSVASEMASRSEESCDMAIKAD